RGIDESGIQGSTIPIPSEHGGGDHHNDGVGGVNPLLNKAEEVTQSINLCCTARDDDDDDDDFNSNSETHHELGR
ncbi:hypothetical protein A2U01_0044625, partial [Trifolium medium]|nr:hypothetical protein [Trifolium medium]